MKRGEKKEGLSLPLSPSLFRSAHSIICPLTTAALCVGRQTFGFWQWSWPCSLFFFKDTSVISITMVMVMMMLIIMITLSEDIFVGLSMVNCHFLLKCTVAILRSVNNSVITASWHIHVNDYTAGFKIKAIINQHVCLNKIVGHNNSDIPTVVSAFLFLICATQVLVLYVCIFRVTTGNHYW